MTDRKKKILGVALKLFANDGFNGTSTKKIAKEANVSEGLIFRHFGNKKGLLNALVQQAAERTSVLVAPILKEAHPKIVIQKTIELPFTITENEYSFWKLQFKLKWENDYKSNEKMKPLLDHLSWAFSALRYPEPEKEAVILNYIVESIAIGILRDGTQSHESLKTFLIEKYKTLLL